MLVRGLLHVHSNYSYDGKESLSSLKQFLIGKGINFCCLTEHTDFLTKEKAEAMMTEAKALSDENFVFIPGFEVPYKSAHILQIGSENWLGQMADDRLLLEWSEQSPLTILAHPVRNDFIVNDVMLAAIDGVEIWNQQYEGKIVPRPRAIKLLRTLKSRKAELLATGGTDFHRLEHFGAPIYQLEVDRLSPSTILEKLKSGEYIFGNESFQVNSDVSFSGNTNGMALKSSLSLGLINFGKFINKTLAIVGIKFPKSLKQMIRSKV